MNNASDTVAASAAGGLADPEATRTELLELEVHSIDYIPLDQREGSAKHLFTLWFGANAMAITLVTGAIAATTGMGLLWACIAIAVGALVGTVFLAYHSAQGPHLGLPQMIQSRAQFGFYGANIPMIIVILMYVGFYASGVIIAAQSLNMLFGTSTTVGIVIVTVLSLTLVLFGYKMMHLVGRIVTPIYIAVFGLLTVALIVHWGSFPTHHAAAATTFQITPFMLIVSIVAAYYISYGPYVADYSRYLPAETSVRAAFWWTYGGVIISAIWIMIVGAAAQAGFSAEDAVTATASVAASLGEWFRSVLLIVFVVGIGYINAFNIYGAMMSSLTVTTTLFQRLRTSRHLRLMFIVPIALIGGGIAAFASNHFLTDYENFIFFIITFLIPWSAVNLVDYYFVRRGRYDVEDLFTPNGRYGAVSWAGLAAYLLGCACQVPFIDQTFYVGPIASSLGFDISWIVGIIVPGTLYYVIMRQMRPAPNAVVERPVADDRPIALEVS